MENPRESHPISGSSGHIRRRWIKQDWKGEIVFYKACKVVKSYYYKYWGNHDLVRGDSTERHWGRCRHTPKGVCEKKRPFLLPLY